MQICEKVNKITLLCALKIANGQTIESYFDIFSIPFVKFHTEAKLKTCDRKQESRRNGKKKPIKFNNEKKQDKKKVSKA